MQIGKHSVVYAVARGGGGRGLSVSVFEICEEPWVTFWENIAKLLEGRFRINKLNVPLEMKGLKMCNIEIFWQRKCKICMMIFFVF